MGRVILNTAAFFGSWLRRTVGRRRITAVVRRPASLARGGTAITRPTRAITTSTGTGQNGKPLFFVRENPQYVSANVGAPTVTAIFEVPVVRPVLVFAHAGKLPHTGLSTRTAPVLEPNACSIYAGTRLPR